MFRNFTSGLIYIFTLTTIFFNSCKPEDDTVDPVIILKADALNRINPFNIDSIGSSFTDPGYTAVDDVDGDITDRVTVQYPIIGTDSARTYQAIYTVRDNAGNIFTTYRTINIRNTTALIEGVYNHDTLKCPNDSDVIYQSTITGSLVTNGEFGIGNFANKGQQAIVNGKFDAAGNLTFPNPVVSLLDSDSTVVNIQSGNYTPNPNFRLELLFWMKVDTIPDSVQCTVIMAR